ncbi:phage holin, LLH family [Candidatus Proelusimicrobium excrementi]|uniref:phage holin, LLH family n=1 Tax=Candidatus Proelusimicrobium excrementi TaxID=3416222 RepID=UPI003CB42A5E|nr:hypothetical protein [Elusimicrobiaceae bacterium]MBR3927730.1 holin [Clostridia bacterium]
MVDLTNIFEALIALVSSVVTVFLIPWLKTKLNNEQLSKAHSIVQIGVFAAEKLYGAGRGAEKFAYVEELLAAKKIKLDTKTLTAMIEAEVKKLDMVVPNKAFDVHDAMIVDEPEEEEEDETAENMEVVDNGA